MSCESVSSSDDIISNKSDKTDSSSADTLRSEQSSQRLSPVPSCTSMKTSQSMDHPVTIRNNSSDEYSSTNRGRLLLQKKRVCKSQSRSACVCDESCSQRTHKRLHAQPCFCCGGNVTPCCSIHKQNYSQNVDELVVDDSVKRGARSSCLFWMLFLLFGGFFVSGAAVYFAGSSPVLQEDKPQAELRLMLLGRSGAGKSSSGNTIVGASVFEEALSFLPVTRACETHSAVILGRKVKITDTPGFTNGSFVKCFSNESAIHAFLLVIRLGRITQEELDYVRLVSEKIGSGALKHTLLLFTGGDLLEEKSLTELLDHSPPALKEIISMCGGGYHVFNNKDSTDSKQVKALFLKIEALMYSSGVYNQDANTMEDVKNVPEHTETFSVVLITCAILLTLEILRFVSPFAVVRKLYVSITQTAKHDTGNPKREPEKVDDVQEVCMTDEMKEEEIRHIRKVISELGKDNGQRCAKDLTKSTTATQGSSMYSGNIYVDDYDYDDYYD